MSHPWPVEGNTYIPVFPDPPKIPHPLPGTKRYVLFRQGVMIHETDDRAEALALILSGTCGDTLCDRERK